MVRNIEVCGGYITGEDSKDSKNNKSQEKSKAIFMEKRSEVVPEDKLGAFFRRDWDMCGMPKIVLRVTNKQPTVEF